MMNLRKTVIIFVLFALMLSSFAGCGQGKENTNTSTAAQESSQETAEATQETTAVNVPKPTLKALMGYKSGLDYNNYPAQKYLEEKTGYKVIYETLPQDNAMDKLNIIIASGQEYDFVNFNDKARYSYYATQGALVDLEPLVNSYGPNISKNIDSTTFDNIRVDGKYYAIITTSASGREVTTNVKGGALVRQDWMDKLGIKMPATIDDFTGMLQLFKDKDPNGNGAKNIPFTLDQNLNTPNIFNYGLGGAFGIATDWLEVDGKLVPREEMPGFKDFILYLKDIYNKGLLDKETPTNQGTTAKEKFTSGRAGVFFDNWSDMPTVGDTFKKTQPDATYIFMPPLSGAAGDAVLVAGDLKSAIDMYTVIPKGSKRAEDVIKYLNLKMDEEIFKGMVIGEENVTYTVKDGNYYPITPIFFDQRGNSNQFLTGATKNYGKYWLARLRKDDRTFTGWQKLNVDYDQYVKIDVMSKAPIMNSYTKNKTSLDKMTVDFILKSIVSDFSDDRLNAFVVEWKAKGGEEGIKEVNDWYKTAGKQ